VTYGVPRGDSYALTDAFERVAVGLPREREFAGLEVVATSARRHGEDTELRLVIDRPQGVDVFLCERVSARINAALDAFTDPYTLEVRSAGLDRPLLRPADYERFAGRNVRIHTSLTIANAKTHRGRLGGLRGSNVILETERGELPLPIDTIRSANLEYDFRADLQREKRARKNRGKKHRES
jgi:ribosome maturation factor RimP